MANSLQTLRRLAINWGVNDWHDAQRHQNQIRNFFLNPFVVLDVRGLDWTEERYERAAMHEIASQKQTP